jgi:hypothetical protein
MGQVINRSKKTVSTTIPENNDNKTKEEKVVKKSMTLLNYENNKCFAISSEKQGTIEISKNEASYFVTLLKNKRPEWIELINILDKWSTIEPNECLLKKIPTKILFDEYSDDKFDWIACSLNKKNSYYAIEYVRKREELQLLSKDYILYYTDRTVRISSYDAKLLHNILSEKTYQSNTIFKNILRRASLDKKEYGSKFKISREDMLWLVDEIYKID